MKFRPSNETDTDRITELIRQAKEFLKSSGVNQWQNGYPDRFSIVEDISAGTGYVLTDGPEVVGYMCVSFDGEAAYEHIDGAWKSIQDYAVIHRAVIDNACKGRGLAGAMLEFAETLCVLRGIHSIKVDTDQDNRVMRHVLEKNGYQFCGGIRFDNSDKIAFEKLL